MRFIKQMEKKIYDVVVMLIEKNIDVFKRNIYFIRKNLNARETVVICSRIVKKKILDLNVKIINENELYDGLSLNSVKNLLAHRNANIERAGWYFQQFLKMAYAYKNTSEYYLIWDADTIPLKKLSFFDGGTMLLNMKNERNKAYFSTMDKLFDGKLNIISANSPNPSFISEGMIIKTVIMKDMIGQIMKANISGEQFWGKIINAIDDENLSKSGFSEFETYGSYLNTYYSEEIKIRYLQTERRGYILFNDIPSDDILNTLPYDTISFEYWDYKKTYHQKIYELVKMKIKRILNRRFNCNYREM